MKECSKCKKTKDSSSFYYRSDKPHLLQSHCIACIKVKRKKYRLENIEAVKRKDLIYCKKNRKKRIAYGKKYYIKTKAIRADYLRFRYHNDSLFKLQSLIRTRIRSAIKKNAKSGSSLELLGCSVAFFKQYFESLFDETMTWNKFMRGEIQIDHIIPCHSFDFSKKQEQKRCFNYKNLQPLYAKENREKWYKMPEVCYRKTTN